MHDPPFFHTIDWLYLVLRPVQEFFTYTEMSPLHLLVKGCKIEAYARRSGPLSREGLSCHTCCNMGPQFFWSHLKDRPFSHLLRHTRGCGGSILIWILTGLLSYEEGTYQTCFKYGHTRLYKEYTVYHFHVDNVL
jgi:hypothetical protein